MAKRFRLEYSDYSANIMRNGVSYFDTLKEAKETASSHHHFRIVDTKVNAEVVVGGKTPDAEQVDVATPAPVEAPAE